nr:hypothetical protein [Tanacetum cinerariifolium]
YDQSHRAHQQNEVAWHRQAQELQSLADQQTTLDTWLIDHSHEAELKDQLRELSREIIDLQEAQKEIATRETRRGELLKNQQTTLADLGRQQQVEAEALARQHAIIAEGQPCRTEREALLLGTSPAEALAAQVAQEAPALATAETAVRHLEAQQQASQQLLESLRRELRLQQALADLNTHRQHLRPGEACPLCGATEHVLGADFSADSNEQEQRGEQLALITLQLAAAAEDLAAQQLAFEQQQAARLAYYAGTDPAAEAERLRRHTQQLAEAERTTRQQHAQQQQELAIKQNAHTVLQTQLASHRLAHDERQAELAAALGAAGFASVAEAQALLLPAAEAERLHQRRQQHLTATAAAAHRLADLTAEQQQHAEFALTPLSAADLTAQLSALSAADDILQQQLGAASNQLAQDDAARERLAEGRRELQLRQLEEQRWQDLADQIGSAK